MPLTFTTRREAPGRAARRHFDTYLFDLDGTIYLGTDLLPGAAELVSTLRAQGARVLFVSNNPTRSPQDYADKLTRLGIPTGHEDVYTSLVATVAWVRAHAPGATVFPISEQPLVDALVAEGCTISDDPEKIDLVVASYDRSFDYRKLQVAFDTLFVHGRALFVATNPDRFCPFPGGRGEPDCASVVAAITAATGVACEAVFGKPDPAFLEIIAAETGLDPATTVMVGDRLSTDVAFARATGMTSALVLTGETDRATALRTPAAQAPTLLLERVDDLLQPAGHLWDVARREVRA